MATKNQITYSRDEVVSELTSFYEFLVELYLPSSALKYPPPTPEYLAFMKENDTVVDLIRHIPFIRPDEDSEPYQIYEKTSAVDYNGGTFHGIASLDKPYPDVADPLEEMTTLPSHVVTFAKTSGGRDGYYIFLDTERGTITYCDFQDGPEHTDLSQGGVKAL